MKFGMELPQNKNYLFIICLLFFDDVIFNKNFQDLYATAFLYKCCCFCKKVDF